MKPMPTALRTAFAARFGAGEMAEAVITSERLLTRSGADATAADHANRALALVAEAQGYVSPEAEAELRAALTLDLTNEAGALSGGRDVPAGRPL